MARYIKHLYKQNEPIAKPTGMRFPVLLVHTSCDPEGIEICMSFGTLVNRYTRTDYGVFQRIREDSVPKAIDAAYQILSRRFPGYYFGYIGRDESRQWWQYGWIADHLRQAED